MTTDRKKKSRWQRKLNYLLHRLFPVHQDRRKVAFSVFLGVFIGVCPTIGVAIFLTAAACALFRVPKLPGMIASFIAIPPTLFFFFYPVGYALGCYLLNPPEITFDFLFEISRLNIKNFTEVIGGLWNNAFPHLQSFLLGITIVAAITGILCYFCTLYVMKLRRQVHNHYRRKHLQSRPELKGVYHG